MTIAEKVRKRRVELGMTQEELAKKCGIKNKSTISMIETGERINVTKGTLQKLSKGLKVSVKSLLDD